MRLPSKSSVVWILLGVAALTALILPTAAARWIRGLFQPVAALQWPVASATRKAADAAHDVLEPRITPEDARRLYHENQELERLVVQQQIALEEYQQRWERVTGLRGVLPGDDVKLVLAPVVSYDADRRRDTLRIGLNERTASLVKVGQWVAAGLLQTPSADLLARQWLIGRISEVQLRFARVQLVTDPKFRVEARVAILDANTRWTLSEESCLVEGVGDGRMVIRQVARDYFAEGYRLVFVPASRELPVPLAIGELQSSRRRSDSSQHWDLSVTPCGSVELLTHVFVITKDR